MIKWSKVKYFFHDYHYPHMSISSTPLSVITFLMGLMVLVFPLAMIIIPESGYIVALMIVLSLVGLLAINENLELNKWERYFILSLVSYFSIVAINLWWFDGSIRDLDTPSRLILVLPIFFFLRNIRLSLNWLMWGIAVGAILAGLARNSLLTIPIISVDFYMHPGFFALISSILGFSSLMLLGKNNSFFLNIALVLGFALGLLGSLLTGTSARGVWIAEFFTLILIIFVNPLAWNKKRIFVSTFLFIAIFSIAYLIPQTAVESRINNAVNNTISWVKSDNANTSTGARLEMWKASYKIIKSSPLIGVGEDNFQKHLKLLIKKGEIDEFVGQFSYPHNEYLTTLVEQGVIGLISLLLVLFIPLKYFLVVVKHGKSTLQQKYSSSIGLVLIFHYIFYSFTEAVMARQFVVLFFATLLVLVMGYTTSEKK